MTEGSQQSRDSSGGSRPNILLVIMDSVRARNTSIHGHENDTTPFLSEFASEAVTYSEARAPGANTITSSASIFTGCTVREHGFFHRRQRLQPGHTIWEELGDGGYRTAIFSSNANLTGVDIGFKSAFEDVYDGRPQQLLYSDAVDPRRSVSDGTIDYSDFLRRSIRSGTPVRSGMNALSLLLDDALGEALPRSLRPKYEDSIYTDLFLDWIDEQSGPWAACINYMDAHIPYRPKDEYDRFSKPTDSWQKITDGSKWEFATGELDFTVFDGIERIYDGAIRQVDAEIRRLVRGLNQHGVADNTLVVITSDHGEAFGEQSNIRDTRNVFHGITGGLHEVLLHVPLIVKYPGQRKPETVDDVVSLTEFPTVVRRVVEGSERPTFQTTDEIFASVPGIDPLAQQQAKNHIDDLTPFTADLDARYETIDGTVQKYLQWGNEGVTLVCDDAQRCRIVDTSYQQQFADRIESLDPAGIVKPHDSSVAPEVKDRLEELGYA